MKELIEDGINPRGKSLNVSRIPSVKTLDNLSSALSMIISLISKEASQEVVMDGLISLLSKYSKKLSELEQKILEAFVKSSITLKYNKAPTTVSFVIHLGTEQKIVNAVLSAYRTYTQLTPIPMIGLVINYEKGVVSNVSEILSEIITLGGKIIFSKHHVSQKGIIYSKNTSVTSLHLCSLSINLPRLAFESNKDETYFRARLALLMKPALTSMTLRKKGISDLVRLGINPVLADSTQYMQRNSVSLIVNLTGLHNAVYGPLGFKDDKNGKEILHKVIETAIDVASKKSKELSVNAMISITESDGSDRFVSLDEEKYGKDSILKITDDETYSQGITLDGDTMTELTAKSAEIIECNKITKILNGGLLVSLKISEGTKVTQIKKLIEKACSVIDSFKPVIKIPVCGNCGFKGEKLVDKCPTCKSSFII